MRGVFRDELKYVLSQRDRAVLLERWRRHLVRDRHTQVDAITPILSQYYDTPAFDFCRDKIDGIWFRNKVRIRTYGTGFRPRQATFLEIKQRLGEQVRKIRQPIEFTGPENLDPSTWRFPDAVAEHAFGSLIHRTNLRPSARVWYQREAYQGTVEPDVRVTFDSFLTGLFPFEEMTRAHIASPERGLLPDQLTILEVKSTSGIPCWVSEGAEFVELVQRSVPKYVMAVERLGIDRLTPGGVYA
jgi:hypothetical protein